MGDQREVEEIVEELNETKANLDDMQANIIPKVKMDTKSLTAGKMYLWKTPYGEIKPVWLSEEYPGYLDEWEDSWEIDKLAGELFGPVDLQN